MGNTSPHFLILNLILKYEYVNAEFNSYLSHCDFSVLHVCKWSIVDESCGI